MSGKCGSAFFFFFNDTATTEIYTLSLHDALPILLRDRPRVSAGAEGQLHARRDQRRELGHLRQRAAVQQGLPPRLLQEDRKSTRLNSSHANISYAVFCLKKKKKLQYD